LYSDNNNEVFILTHLVMSITEDFKNYVSNHISSECFLYNNRMLLSKGITPEQYNLNRDYILARRSERGF
jgi:hypothetical protein